MAKERLAFFEMMGPGGYGQGVAADASETSRRTPGQGRHTRLGGQGRSQGINIQNRFTPPVPGR